MDDAVTFCKAGWTGRCQADFLEAVEGIEAWKREGTAVVDWGNRMVRRLEIDGKGLYAKWLYPQKGFWPALKRLLRRPRVLAVWDVHRAMLAAGIGCPRPVLAAVHADATGLFIAEEVTAPTCRNWFKEAEDSKLQRIVPQMAAAIAALHSAGFVHGDCIPGNVCVDEAGGALFIDNDRTHRWTGKAARLRNLLQFCSHVPAEKEQWCGCLLREYACRCGNVLQTDEIPAFLGRIHARRMQISSEKKS